MRIGEPFVSLLSLRLLLVNSVLNYIKQQNCIEKVLLIYFSSSAGLYRQEVLNNTKQLRSLLKGLIAYASSFLFPGYFLLQLIICHV